MPTNSGPRPGLKNETATGRSINHISIFWESIQGFVHGFVYIVIVMEHFSEFDILKAIKERNDG